MKPHISGQKVTSLGWLHCCKVPVCTKVNRAWVKDATSVLFANTSVLEHFTICSGSLLYVDTRCFIDNVVGFKPSIVHL